MLYSEGVSFTDLPGEVKDQMTPVARLAARSVYTQQIAGEAAPYNRELEAMLQTDWLNALNGGARTFLNHQLTELMGSHDPARLAHWQQRKDELTSADSETLAKLSRRKPWYRMAKQTMEALYPLPPAAQMPELDSPRLRLLPATGEEDVSIHLLPATGDEDARIQLMPFRPDDLQKGQRREQFLGDLIGYIDN